MGQPNKPSWNINVTNTNIISTMFWDSKIVSWGWTDEISVMKLKLGANISSAKTSLNIDFGLHALHVTDVLRKLCLHNRHCFDWLSVLYIICMLSSWYLTVTCLVRTYFLHLHSHLSLLLGKDKFLGSVCYVALILSFLVSVFSSVPVWQLWQWYFLYSIQYNMLY